eukprot:COSAG06_NODE_5090_length_3726_cov_7.050455_5_plen_22_part_01
MTAGAALLCGAIVAAAGAVIGT